MYEGICIKCKNEIELSFPENNECPICGHSGYWDEKYNEDNYWMVWYWDKLKTVFY